MDQDFLRVALLHDDAAVEEGHMIGDLTSELQLMGDHDHGAALCREVPHDAEHLAHGLWIERRRGFIEEQYPRLESKGTGDAHTLLLTARELIRVGIGLLCQANPSQQRPGLGFHLSFWSTLGVDRALHEVLQRGPVREQVVRLEDHAGCAPQSREGLLAGWTGEVDRDVADRDRAALRLLQQVEAAQQRGLSRTRGADEHGD